MGDIEILSPFLKNSQEVIEKTREKLTKKLEYKPKYEVNFVFSGNSLICCFDGKTLYITDKNLRAILYYESTSYINACSISRGGLFAVFQTANNKENNSDSGATAIFDIKTKQMLCKKRIPTGWKGVTHIFVDEEKREICFYYGDEKHFYDFDLNLKE